MSVTNPVLQLDEDHDEALPASPPAEVTSAIQAAFERSAALVDANRQLHFRIELDGGLVIEIRDLQGCRIRTVMPSQALGIMSAADVD